VRSFTIKDVTTGETIKLGGGDQPYYGVVIGRSRGTEAGRKPKSKRSTE
jgi:hypothetical protein